MQQKRYLQAVLVALSCAATSSADEVSAEEDEIVEIWAEREDKPFDRDTSLRLTNQDLLDRGITDLADALNNIPELRVRVMGRGGKQVNIRGARKGSVKVLIDGIPIADPYYGTTDITAIPVTDIAEIRVSGAPASPIDGLGGPGGIVEVHTFDAYGNSAARVRVAAGSLPEYRFSGTARGDVAGIATRLNFHAARQNRLLLQEDGAIPSLRQNQWTAGARGRFEKRFGNRRLGLDLSLLNKSYVVPPGADGIRAITSVDKESQESIAATLSDRWGKMNVDVFLHGAHLTKHSRFLPAPGGVETGFENLRGLSLGGRMVVSRYLNNQLALLGSVAADYAQAESKRAQITETGNTQATNAALGITFNNGSWDIRLAGGITVPISVGDSPWLEYKFSTTWKVAKYTKLNVVAARKGRLPTIREFFQDGTGNKELNPEVADYASLGGSYQSESLDITAEGFAKRTTGLLRFSSSEGRLVNLGRTDFIGADFRAIAFANHLIGGEATYNYIFVTDEIQGDDPLDFLPKHRFEVAATSKVKSWRLRLRARYLSEQIDAATTIPSQLTTHFTAIKNFKDVAFTLRVDNVFDRRPLIRSGGVFDSGRTIFLALSARLD